MALSNRFDRLVYHTTIRVAPILAKLNINFFASKVKNPIFLLGNGRSGTTLLANLLALHSDIANWSEANDIWDPEWYPWRPSVQSLHPMEFEPYSFTERWWKSAEPRQNEIRAIFGAYQWLNHKSHFLNKTPYSTFRIPHLVTMFPDARYIHIIRDGRAAAYSYAKKLTRENKLQEWPEPQRTTFTESFDELLVWLASFWQTGIEEIIKQDNELKLTEQGSMLEISYEELCADTSGTLQRVCDHLGLQVSRFRPAVWDVDTLNQNHKWQDRLDPDMVQRIEDAMNPMLAERGYTHQ